MQSQDRDTLLQICQRELPETLTADYVLWRAAWERVKSGPMSAELLIALAIKHDCVTVKAVVVSDWTRVPIGSPVQIFKPFNLNEHYADGTFHGVGEGLQTGLIHVAVFCDLDNVNPYPERRIRLKGEMPKAEEPKKPIPVDATQPIELELVDEELAKLEPPEDLGEAIVPKSGDWACVAVGTAVDVDTGSGMFVGEFVGVGADKNLGAVAVRIPSLHKGRGKNARKFGWYEEDNVVVRKTTLPIEEVVQQTELSVEKPVVTGA